MASLSLPGARCGLLPDQRLPRLKTSRRPRSRPTTAPTGRDPTTASTCSCDRGPRASTRRSSRPRSRRSARARTPRSVEAQHLDLDLAGSFATLPFACRLSGHAYASGRPPRLEPGDLARLPGGGVRLPLQGYLRIGHRLDGLVCTAPEGGGVAFPTSPARLRRPGRRRARTAREGDRDGQARFRRLRPPSTAPKATAVTSHNVV